MENLPKVSETVNADVTYRRVSRVFHMVHELHKVGYQGLRIVTAASGSGHYRFYAIPSSVMWYSRNGRISPESVSHLQLGSETPRPTDDTAYYGNNMEDHFFGWPDGPGKNARELANLFIKRYPRIAELSLHDDWPYAGWFTKLLGKVDNGWIPYCYYVDGEDPLEGMDLASHVGEGADSFPWPPLP